MLDAEVPQFFGDVFSSEGSAMIASGQKGVYLPGDSVDFECPDRQALTGSTRLICLADFSWEGQPPTCQDIGKYQN